MLEGFWLTAWYRRSSLEEAADVLGPLAESIAAGQLSSEVEKIYPIEEAAQAAARADEDGRSGKILITLDPDDPKA